MNGSIAALTRKKLQYTKKINKKQKENNNYNPTSTETKFLNQIQTAPNGQHFYQFVYEKKQHCTKKPLNNHK